MTRSSNPWVLAALVVALLAGGFIGGIVTAISCSPNTCLPNVVAIALLSGIVTAIGVGVVAVLAVRSLGEWRTAGEQGTPLPEPGCETGEDG
ncbi:MAG TPA: hypothetical protein ENH15_05810 [Actinobacteria bacterium]|nr:hypothetical protein [Actinomycetota bacterium]